MTTKEKKIAKQISVRLKKKDPTAEIILFGSHARGQATKDSDWDILILIDQPKTNRSIEDKYRDEMFELELELGEPITTLIYSKQDWNSLYAITPLYHNILKEGLKLG